MEDLDLRNVGKVRTCVGRGLFQQEGIGATTADDGLSGQGELGLGGNAKGIVARVADEECSGSARDLREGIVAETAKDRSDARRTRGRSKRDSGSSGQLECLDRGDVGESRVSDEGVSRRDGDGVVAAAAGD